MIIKKSDILKLSILLFGVAFVMVGSMDPSPLLATSEVSSSDKGKIVVHGTGSVSVKPEIAYITLGITTEDADAQSAQETNAEDMNTLLNAIMKAGYEEEDIKMQSFEIYQLSDPEDPSGEITGYQIVNQFRVTVRDVDNLGTLIDAAHKGGSNNGGEIQFTIEDPTNNYESSLDAAIKNAQLKASAIAKSLKVSIGKPILVTEMSSTYQPILYSNYSSQLTEDEKDLEIGDLTVIAAVEVVYEY